MEDRNIKIHETSLVDENAVIGDETKIWQFCNIMHDVKIGKKCNIGMNVFIENGVIIGNNVTIKNNISLYSGVICEDNTFLGPNCVFTNVLNPRSFISRKNEFKKTIIKKGASIGANATIVCGNEIGNYAMVGAGAVVTKNIENYALVVGNPAKKIGYVCECGERIYPNFSEIYICNRCMKKYKHENNELIEITE